MKILLINPPYIKQIYGAFKRAAPIHLPLGLAYIAAVLETNNFDVQVLDANAEMLSVREAALHAIKSGASIIGLTAATNTIKRVYKIASIVKSIAPERVVIVGGPHPSAVPERTLRECSAIDIIVVGEGEKIIVELVTILAKEEKLKNLMTVKGISFRFNNKIVSTPKQERIANLDELPFPARHLFPWKKYTPGAMLDVGIKKGEFATIITSRGCPNKCTYCSSAHFWGITVRFRSVENIIKEVEHLVEKYRIKELEFVDDTFTASASRVKNFCELLLAKRIKIKWIAYARVNTISKELLQIMKKAGCFRLNFGLESGSQDILNNIKKNITLEQVRNAIKLAKKEGFFVDTSFMIGLPGDTKETVKQTIKFAIELNPHSALFCITTPFPGTELYDEAIAKGWTSRIRSWDDAGLHMKTKFRTDALTSREIYQLYRHAELRFHLRLKYFLLLLNRLISHPRELKSYILGALYLLFGG